MGTRQVAVVLFWVGLVCSLALSLVLVSALMGFGFQPGPIWAKLLGFLLILMPFAALVGRWTTRDGKLFDVVAGSAMMMIVFAYVAIATLRRDTRAEYPSSTTQ